MCVCVCVWVCVCTCVGGGVYEFSRHVRAQAAVPAGEGKRTDPDNTQGWEGASRGDFHAFSHNAPVHTNPCSC